jgi:Family of unknown function (DUF6507)
MTSWSIQPEGVVQVLKNVEAEATELGTSLETLPGSLEAAVTGTQSGAISEAIQGWMEMESPTLKSVSQRINAAMKGAADATKAYIQGDLEMAANVQAAQVQAATAPPVERPSVVP